MGAEGYIWITKFKKNLADALQAAREETFASGNLDNEIQKESGRCSAGCTGRNIRIREIFRCG